ncbi:hypothetical protein JTE90_014922 [Oedothorax gibbosus]|uniref:ENT domain-containing protein n=1 Tax=Oedothorax gibbosus TaxID=931172 RepID=A0AAV6VL75_9ARAC|nr:hypothetical protein JTE90_014922 [Oedothorax gibbosus]
MLFALTYCAVPIKFNGKMWPMFTDDSEKECQDALRSYEINAYSSVIAAFRAQGVLTSDKRRMLEELSIVLNIPIERHKSEIRRAINDEHLNTVSERLFGPNTGTEWAIEARRLLPLMQRLAPQTAFSELANSLATCAAAKNASLPLPGKTGTIEIEEGIETMASRKRRGGSVDLLPPKILALESQFSPGTDFPVRERSASPDCSIIAETCHSPENMSPVSSPFMDFNASKNISSSFMASMSHYSPLFKHVMPKTTSTVTTFSSFDQLTSNLLANRDASQTPAVLHEEQVSTFSDVSKPSSDLKSAHRSSHSSMKSPNNIIPPSSPSPSSSVCSSSLSKDRLQNFPSQSNKFLTQIRSSKNPSHTRQNMPSGLGMKLSPQSHQRPQTMSPKSPLKTKQDGPSFFSKKSPNVFPPIPVSENSLSNDSSSSSFSPKEPTKSPNKQDPCTNPVKTSGNSSRQPQNIISKHPPPKSTTNHTQYNISRSLFSSSPSSTTSKGAQSKPVIFNVTSPPSTMPQSSSPKMTGVTTSVDGPKPSQPGVPKVSVPGMSTSGMKLSTSTASTFQYRNSDGGVVRSARIVNISQPTGNRLPCAINPSTISALGLQTGMTSTTALRVTVPAGTINTSSSSIRVSAAAKPNVIVVHKAQVWPRPQSQGALIMSSTPLVKIPNDIAQESVSNSQKPDKNKPSGSKTTSRTISSVRPVSPGVSIISTEKVPATKAVPKPSSTPRPTTEAHNSKPPENSTDVQCKKNLLADIMEASGILLESTARNKAMKDKGSSVKSNKEMSNHDEIEIIGQKMSSVSSSSEIPSSRLSESNASKKGTESKASGSLTVKSVNRNGVVTQNKESTQAQSLESQTKDTCNSVVSSSSHLTNETVTSSTECGSKSQQEVT